MSTSYLLHHNQPDMWRKVIQLVAARDISIKDLILRLLQEELEREEEKNKE